MSHSHITFSQMSDFHDDQVQTVDERQAIQSHLSQCPQCSEEFTRLSKTIGFLSRLAEEDYHLENMSRKTLSRARLRRNRGMFMKFVPALAAAAVVVAVWGFRTDVRENAPVSGMASGSGDVRKSDKGDAEKVVNVISKYRGKILQVSDQYVEGEIPSDKFNRLLRDLGNSGFQKIHYREVSESENAYSSVNLASRYRYLQNVEEVGAGDIIVDENPHKTSVQKHSIRFRVFK